MTANLIEEIIRNRKKSLEKDVNLIKESINLKRKTFRKPLSENIKRNGEISIISEIKPSSPTLGTIRNDIDVREIAKIMEDAGVIGLSVLTEPNYFNGSYNNLKIAIESTKLPCLMKDFVIDEIQFQIASNLGATNILLINDICKLEKMFELALEYNLEPLIEIHDIAEINDIKHLIEIGFIPKLIGVNNRNLKTLKIDLNNSKIIIPKIKEYVENDAKVISESGINTIEEINSLLSFKTDAFLIGSSIMKSNNIKEKIISLRGVI